MVSVNLRHLAVFREVAQRGGVNAAARAVFLSQPAVTQAVAAIERHFGLPCFERRSSGMRLTPAGERCLYRIDRALRELRAAWVDPLRRAGSATAGPGRRGVTFTQLEALTAVAAHGGFQASAESLGIAPPTLHRAARSLEQALGLTLFERTSFGIRASREGERLARHAQLAFAELAQARAEIAALRGQDAGRTVIGVLPLARSFLVPDAVLRFTAAHPRHSVELLDGPYETLLAALRTGAADLLVGALRLPAPAPDVREEVLFDDPLALVVRVGHPLKSTRTPTVRALGRYPWIAPRTGSPLRRRFVDLFEHAGEPVPTGLIECNSFLAARSLLRHSDRVMLLSAHQIEAELEAGWLTTLPHPEGLVCRRIGLTVRSRWQPTAAQQDLLARLRAAAARIGISDSRSERPRAGRRSGSSRSGA